MEVTCLSLKDVLNVRKLINNSLSEETDCIKEQKENICADRKKITPLKCESATAGFGGLKPDIIHITPIKQSEKASPDPWTPTANLKMLISAASPDIRDREMKKILFRPIENEDNTAEEEDEELDESCQLESLDDAEKRPSRKQKSLGLLCQKFLALYPDYPGTSESVRISLDEVATCLGVERRRIYDIVNVLESLLLVSRMAKNLYVWHGRSQLAQRLKELYQAGRESGYHLQMNGANTHSPQNMQAASSRRKDKSLRIMSQKFVMLFLVSKTRTVTLDLAAKILIEEGQDESSHSKYKTKVRRLYDIANVLTSLNLIKKLQAREEKSRKPVFKWIGPTDFCSESESKNNATVERREKMPRHSSFQVLPPPPVNLRPINSAPSTPHRDDDNPVDYSRKSAIRLHFGEGGSAGVSAGPAPLAVPLSAETPCPSLPLAYLPQTPLLMLYSGHVPEVVGQGQRSPVSVSRKRERPEEEEEEQGMLKRIHRSPSIESVMAESESPSSSVRRSPVSSRGSSSWDEALNETESGALNATEPVMSSHYLYVPTTTGLNNFNFLMSAGHNQSSMILPCFLLPSPLIAGTVPTSSADAGLRFNVPSVMSPARFVMAEAKTPSSPEHHGHELSPQRPQMHQSPPTSKTPVTPKDDAMSKSFFETPGDCDSLSIPPASRKKGSVHRRLDIGHTTAS